MAKGQFGSAFRLFILSLKSCGSANVCMMKATNTRKLNHSTLLRRIYRASFRTVLAEK